MRIVPRLLRSGEATAMRMEIHNDGTDGDFRIVGTLVDIINGSYGKANVGSSFVVKWLNANTEYFSIPHGSFSEAQLGVVGMFTDRPQILSLAGGGLYAFLDDDWPPDGKALTFYFDFDIFKKVGGKIGNTRKVALSVDRSRAWRLAPR
jgi:hypothetical protein